MNLNLTSEIINHILANFLIVPSNFINLDNTKSLMKKEFLLEHKLKIELDSQVKEKNIWGCSINYNEIKILASNCSTYDDSFDFVFLFTAKDTPTYGLFLNYEKNGMYDPLIACSLDGKNWLECNIGLQANFLSGIEQLKDFSFDWKKVTEYSKEYEYLINFIKFHSTVCESRQS